MSVVDTVKSWFARERKRLVWEPIPEDRTSGQPLATGVAAVAGQHYFRISVAEAFLNQDVEWFRRVDPAIHGNVRCQFGGKTLEFPQLFDVTRLLEGTGGVQQAEFFNVRLSPLLPFRGGDVTFAIGLLASESKDYLAVALKSIGGVAALLGAPQFTAVLAAAGPVAEGIRNIVDADTGRIRLAVGETFTSSTLRDEYRILMGKNVDPQQLARFSVANGRLEVDGQANRPTGLDYLLIKIDVVDKRDDWADLTSIATPFNDATRALAEGNTAQADAALRATILAILRSDELTEAHARIAVEGAKSKFKQLREQLSVSGLVAAEIDGLASAVAGASAADAIRRGPITETEAFADWPGGPM